MKAIIDGDMILYASASNNVVQVVHNDEVICCQADPKDGFIQYMQRTERIADDLNLNPEVDLMHCFTEKGMFRRDLAPTYKANRKAPKPMGYYAIKDKCTELPWAFMHEQVEADDLIGIFTTQFTELNEQCVIVSGDKDLLQIPGWHYWPEPFWGAKTKEGLRAFFKDFGMEEHSPYSFTIPPAAAERFFWAQVLAGDSTDGIEGVPGTGMVTATREVSKWKLEEPMECWEKVVRLYAKKGKTESDATTQARLVRILRNHEYNLTTSELNLWTPPKK